MALQEVALKAVLMDVHSVVLSVVMRAASWEEQSVEKKAVSMAALMDVLTVACLVENWVDN